MTIDITRGFIFQHEVPNAKCVLVLKSDTQKIILSDIQNKDGKIYLVADVEITKKYRPNNYKFQIIDDAGIVSEGEAIVRQNFLYADENQSVKTHNEIILQAIEAQIGGIATQAQSSISVGDKSISYMTFDELIKAREFFKKKVAEQKKKHIAGNEAKIKYVWGL